MISSISKFIQEKYNSYEKERIRKIAYKKIIKEPTLIKFGILDLVQQMINTSFQNHTMASMYREIGTFLLNMGQPEVAKKYYKLSLNKSNNVATYSLYLQCLLMDPSCTDEQMYIEASKFNQFFSGINQIKLLSNQLDENKIINIGYICHFFHNSVSQSLLLPFLKVHNRQRIKVFCYSDTESHEVSDNVKNHADVWRDTKKLDDETLALQIRNDQIDILLELNGHVIMNRYGVLARKAAPIQISYYNQLATSGLATVDYLLIGEGVSLPQSKFYSETFYAMNGIQGIAIFPNTFPPVSPSPHVKNGYITFGSFGAAHKVNAQIVKVWCRILKKVPNSHFFIKSGVLTHEPFLRAYKLLFEMEGMDLSRIHFEGFSEHHKMLERYADVDLALDTFPYTAGTTTMEALWQGVPVITLTGQKYCSQNGKVLCSCIGHPEFVTYSEDEYIAKAVELANNPNQLIAYRNRLRVDFKGSPLADEKSFATRLEDAYIDMWKKYCKSKNGMNNIQKTL